jgi:hypothetical protein
VRQRGPWTLLLSDKPPYVLWYSIIEDLGWSTKTELLKMVERALTAAIADRLESKVGEALEGMLILLRRELNGLNSSRTEAA